MRWFIKFAMLFLTAMVAGAMFAQNQVNPNNGIRWQASSGSGSPTLSCTGVETATTAGFDHLYTDITNNAQYVCSGSLGVPAWQKLGAAGSITLSGDVNGPSGANYLATVNSAPGACGDGTHVCAVTTNAKGLVTAQTATAISFPSSTITASPQYQLPFYSAAGTAQTLTGDPNIVDGQNGNLTLGTITGYDGSLTLWANTHSVTIATPSTSTNTILLTLPVTGNDVLANLTGAQTFTNKSIGGGEINSGLVGVTYGGTGANLSATGGTSQVLKQTTVGGAVTVGQLSCSDLSNAGTGCSGSAPTGANPTATATGAAINGTANTFMRSDAAPAINTASSTTLGLAKCDGVTITCTSGQMVAVGSAPSGSAGGDLSGTYPNPTVAKVNGGAPPTNGDVGAWNGSGQPVDAGFLPANVAQINSNNNFSVTQILHQLNTATSSMNYGSNRLDFYYDYWTGSSPTTGQCEIQSAPASGTNPAVTLSLSCPAAPSTAIVNVNSMKITGLANGSASTDAAAFGQIPTSLPASSVTPGTTTVIGATAPCALTNSTGTTMGCLGYTSANTNSTIVERDGSGNFAAGAVTTTSVSGTDGSEGMVMRPIVSTSGYGGLYAVGVTPSATNFALSSNGAVTYLNGTTSASLLVGGTGVLACTSAICISSVEMSVASLVDAGITTTPSTAVICPNGTLGAFTTSGCQVNYTQLTGTVPTWNQNTTGTAANITATSNSTLTSLPNLAGIGTITSGIWNGTRLTSSYIPTDVAYYDANNAWSVTQNFTNATFSKTGNCPNTVYIANGSNTLYAQVVGSSPCVGTWDANSTVLESNGGNFIIDAYTGIIKFQNARNLYGWVDSNGFEGAIGQGTAYAGSFTNVTVSAASGNAALTMQSAAGAYSSVFTMNAAGGGDGYINVTGASSNVLFFQTGGTNRASVDSNGFEGAIGQGTAYAGTFTTLYAGGTGSGNLVCTQNGTNCPTSYSLGGTLSSSNISLGAAAGTGASSFISGLDGNFYVNITTGTLPATSDRIFTVTYTASRGHLSACTFSPNGTVTAAADIASLVNVTFTTTTMYLSVGTTALTAATSYTWTISCP